MSAAGAEQPRLQALCAAAGILIGIAGALYILATRSRPAFGLGYHLPLAVAFGAWLAYLALHARGRTLFADAAGAAGAWLLVWGRLALEWPLSGHGVLAAFLMLRAPWPWLRAFALLILVQAAITKWVCDLQPLSVLWGALAGTALAVAVRRLDG